MISLRKGLLTGLVAIVPFLAAYGCGSDDEKSGGGGGSGGSGGADPGLFGDQVPVTDTVQLENVTGSINAVRDRYGMFHIYARNVEDAFRAQGYLMAMDRAPQLDLVRRFAMGSVAEAYGGADPGTIDDDISMRHIGLNRAAQAIYDALDAESELKRALDAFADGVSQYFRKIRDGSLQLPAVFLGARPEFFQDWTPVETLAIGRLQSWDLSYDAGSEMGFSERLQAARTTFVSTATDPEVAKRAGFAKDVFRFDAPVHATPLTDYPDEPLQALMRQGSLRPAPTATARAGRTIRSAPYVSPRTFERARRFRESIQRVRDLLAGDEFFGSNNWAVAGSQTASGHALVANDPHLGLDGPMVFWPTHIVVQNEQDPTTDLDAIGLAFPGIPGVILGSNANVAWAATTCGYDVTDVYREQLSGDGSGVTFKGQTVAFEHVSETVKIADSADYTFDVLVVPHHGPLVPEIANHQVVAPAAGGEAFSVKWTGHEPTLEVEAVTNLLRAKTVREAQAVMEPFGVGAQNWVFGDVSGDIAWFTPARLPYRDPRSFTGWDPATYTGVFPGMVLDGASGEHEWTGEYLDTRYIPKLTAPAKGWVATANTDNVASTLDNDPGNDTLPDGTPFYIGFDFAEGFRLGRIEERLQAVLGSATPEQMSAIQGDTKSALGSRIAPRLISALENAEDERLNPGNHPDLAEVVADPRYAAADIPALIDTLQRWGSEADYDAASGMTPDNTLDSDATATLAARATVVFNTWLVRAMALVLEDESQQLGRSNMGTSYTARTFIRLLEEDPTTLATYDASSGQSALWDDMGTANTVETPDERLARAMLLAVDDIDGIFGQDRNEWRWGKLHTIRFDTLMPLWRVSIPPIDSSQFPAGFPRHGDQWNVDASNFSITRSLSSDLSFSYGSGPVQRFVAEMTPDGPVIHNALPGGAVGDPESPFFANEAEYWRKNETHEVPFQMADVVAAAVDPGGEHILFTR